MQMGTKTGTSDHSEYREGEVFLTNDVPEGVHHWSHFKTLRVGKVAYKTDGTVADGFVPLFVMEHDFRQIKKMHV